MRYNILLLLLITMLRLSAQIDSTAKPTADTIVHIALLLNIDQQHAAWKIYGALNDKEAAQGDMSRLKAASHEALDFYQGLQYALSVNTPHVSLDISLFDTYSNDSILMEILRNDTVRHADFIIGPPDLSGAKMVASFCKKYKIPNVQPFIASKALTVDNPFLLRLCPTIDAHLAKMVQTVCTTYPTANVVVYSTARERDRMAAAYIDTLFRAYNADSIHPAIHYRVVNAGDTAIPASKRAYSYYMQESGQNVLILTCYDDAFVNTQLRGIKDAVVFGMPTWIDAEQIKPEYLNAAQPYFTDPFYADTSRAELLQFIHNYEATNLQKPSRYCYLGYDVMNYLSNVMSLHGRHIIKGITVMRFDGLGYSFDIRPVMRANKAGKATINYYSSQAVHLFQIRDYSVWRVD